MLSSSQSSILVDSRNYMFLLLVVLLCAEFLEREKRVFQVLEHFLCSVRAKGIKAALTVSSVGKDFVS